MSVPAPDADQHLDGSTNNHLSYLVNLFIPTPPNAYKMYHLTAAAKSS